MAYYWHFGWPLDSFPFSSVFKLPVMIKSTGLTLPQIPDPGCTDICEEIILQYESRQKTKLGEGRGGTLGPRKPPSPFVYQ